MLSTPWLGLVLVLGFLPFSEVSCRSPEGTMRLTQSGYQAVYGGVSSPFDVLDADARQQLKLQGGQLDTRQLASDVENARSGFLMACSPFMVVFWVSLLAALALASLLPLGRGRLQWCGGFGAAMLVMLVLVLVFGTPLELRFDKALSMAVRANPEQAAVLVSALVSGKTAWYWVAFGSVLAFLVCEAVANLVWNTHLPGSATYPLLAVAAAVVLTGFGVIAQVTMWQLGVTGMEAKLSKIKQAEQAKAAREEEEERRAAAEQRRRQQELALENQRSRNQLDQEEKRQRLARENMRLEAERKERERQEREEKERRETEERERQAAAEREREAARREAERKESLERQGLPYYPRPTTLYNGKNAEEWYQAALHQRGNAALQSNAETALAALKEEGMPFLLDSLGRQSTTAGVEYMLRLINVDYVHPNDLPKIVALVKNRHWANSARMTALRMLRKRAESRRYSGQIEAAVQDLLLVPRLNGEVKEVLEWLSKK